MKPWLQQLIKIIWIKSFCIALQGTMIKFWNNEIKYRNYRKSLYTESICTPPSKEKNDIHFHPNHSYSQKKKSSLP